MGGADPETTAPPAAAYEGSDGFRKEITITDP